MYFRLNVTAVKQNNSGCFDWEEVIESLSLRSLAVSFRDLF